MVPSELTRIPTLLHDGIRVVDVAERCRSAAMAFTNGAEGWDKADLAAWLVSEYSEASRTGASIPPPGVPFSAPRRRTVETAAVDELLADARVRVLTALENAAISRDKTAFAQKFVAEHGLHRITDRAGVMGFIPVNAPRLRLAYRVLTLFAADALTRPGDYEMLTVCHRCEGVRFRDVEPHCERCEKRASA